MACKQLIDAGPRSPACAPGLPISWQLIGHPPAPRAGRRRRAQCATVMAATWAASKIGDQRDVQDCHGTEMHNPAIPDTETQMSRDAKTEPPAAAGCAAARRWP